MPNVQSAIACREETVYLQRIGVWPQDYETFSMLNSAEHEIYPAHKC